MKTFCKLTTQSPVASYVPLPRFLLQDEALRDISNDAKVLYALLLDRASISRQNGYVEPDGTIRLSLWGQAVLPYSASCIRIRLRFLLCIGAPPPLNGFQFHYYHAPF